MKLVDIGVEIPVEDITQSPYHLRKETAEENLDDLAGSIEQVGLIHAISVVRGPDGKVQLTNGHRRYLAHVRLGREMIRANIYEFSEEELADEQKRQMAVAQFLLAANQSEPLIPLERARYYGEAMAQFGLTVEELSRIHNRPISEIVSDLKWLNLSTKVTDLVAEHRNKFSNDHLRMLAEYSSPEKKGWRLNEDEQLSLARKVVEQEDKRIAVDPKELERQIRQLKSAERKRKGALRKAEREAAKEEARRTQPMQVIKEIVLALSKIEYAGAALEKITIPEGTAIELVDKRAIIEQCYRVAEMLTDFAEQKMSPVAVKRVALEVGGGEGAS